MRWTTDELLKLRQPAQRAKISPPYAAREASEVDRHQACHQVKVIFIIPACRHQGLRGSRRVGDHKHTVTSKTLTM